MRSTYAILWPLAKSRVILIERHGTQRQIVPFAESGLLQSKFVKGAIMNVYKGAPHGLCTTLKDRVNADLLALLKTQDSRGDRS